MINIDQYELKKLERLGSGDFGTVYKKDDETAYKIYHKSISDYYSGRETSNPVFILPKHHYKLLISRSKNLKYSGGIKDIIYVNGRFGGVSIPYYEGKTLNTLVNEPIKLKIELSKQIVRNSKELVDNQIYNTDYKLKNMILCNNETKIIDLDDTRTHPTILPNPILKIRSINALGDTIQRLFKIYNHHPVGIKASKELKREKWIYATNFKRIEQYISNMQKEKDILYINEESDIQKLKELISNHGFEIVYIVNKYLENDKYLEIINMLKMNNIELYDFVCTDNIDDYPSIENINKSHLLSKKELIKIKEKN